MELGALLKGAQIVVGVILLAALLFALVAFVGRLAYSAAKGDGVDSEEVSEDGDEEVVEESTLEDGSEEATSRLRSVARVVGFAARFVGYFLAFVILVPLGVFVATTPFYLVRLYDEAPWAALFWLWGQQFGAVPGWVVFFLPLAFSLVGLLLGRAAD